MSSKRGSIIIHGPGRGGGVVIPLSCEELRALLALVGPLVVAGDRVTTWKCAAEDIGVTPTPVPTFPVRITGCVVRLATLEDLNQR